MDQKLKNDQCEQVIVQQALLTPSIKKCKQKTNFRLLYLHECF